MEEIKNFIESLSEEEKDYIRNNLDELERRLTEDVR